MMVTVSSNENAINWKAKGDERIVQNVRNILRTRKFEVPFMSDLGLSWDFTDSIPETMKSDFAAHVTDVVNKYEPRANVLDVRIESCDENGDYIIAVDLEV